MQKEILKAFLLVAVLLPLLLACSGSSELTDRKDQEAAFSTAFGFSPASEITEIKYFELYNRGPVDGAYGQWIRCTYQPAVFDQILKEKKFKETKTPSLPNSKVAPTWWPKTINEDLTFYTQTQDDTPENEGYSFQSYLWCDKSTGFFYFHKYYWD